MQDQQTEGISRPVPETTPSTPVGTYTQSVSINVSHLIGFCALGLLGCFFLPWVTLVFRKVSGFDFTKLGGIYLSLWSIPFFCVLTFFAGITKTSQRNASIFTGILTFGAFGLGVADVGADIFKILEFGGYGSLLLAFLLLALPCRLK